MWEEMWENISENPLFIYKIQYLMRWFGTSPVHHPLEKTPVFRCFLDWAFLLSAYFLHRVLQILCRRGHSIGRVGP